MKTKLLSLAGALLCAVGLSSCAVYDDGYYAGGYGPGRGYYDDGYYGSPVYSGYRGYAPGYTSVGFFGGGYPYGRSYGRHHHHDHDDHRHYSRGRSSSSSYASRVARSSSFRDGGGSPGRSPVVRAPRELSRPTSVSRPSGSYLSSSPSVRSAPRSSAPSIRASASARGVSASARPSNGSGGRAPVRRER